MSDVSSCHDGHVRPHQMRAIREMASGRNWYITRVLDAGCYVEIIYAEPVDGPVPVIGDLFYVPSLMGVAPTFQRHCYATPDENGVAR
jgi:hypothetical protein